MLALILPLCDLPYIFVANLLTLETVGSTYTGINSSHVVSTYTGSNFPTVRSTYTQSNPSTVESIYTDCN